jgi:CubicO group peptidase (beta-lactamase class C family)
LRKTTPVDASRYAAAGGQLTTPTDYAKFLIEVMQPRAADAFRLSKRSLDEMTRSQIDVGNFQGYSVSQGLGWWIVRTASDRILGHGGANPGFQCHSGMSPAKKSGTAVVDAHRYR